MVVVSPLPRRSASTPPSMSLSHLHPGSKVPLPIGKQNNTGDWRWRGPADARSLGRMHPLHFTLQLQIDSHKQRELGGGRHLKGYSHLCLRTPTQRYDSVSSVTQSCPTLCDPMDHSTPGLPVHHQLLGFTQTHVHWVSDAIQPSHPLSSPSLPALNLSQHQGLFKWVSSSRQVANYWSFSFSISPSNQYSGFISLGFTHWISLLSKGLSRVFSNTTVQKHQFFCTQLSVWSNSHIHTWLLEKP